MINLCRRVILKLNDEYKVARDHPDCFMIPEIKWIEYSPGILIRPPRIAPRTKPCWLRAVLALNVLRHDMA